MSTLPSYARYIVGDTRDVVATLPDQSIDLVLTSPPFLALRSYLPGDHPDKGREIGSEADPAAFLQTLLELTADWRRVLAPHGSIAVELGDTYFGSGGGGGDYDGHNIRGGQPRPDGPAKRQRRRNPGDWPLTKSLCGIPHLYHLSLAYGRNLLTGEPSPAGKWRVRNVVAWCKPNPMVGELGDKFRPATTYMTIATPHAKRYFDLHAVREPAVTDETRSAGGKPKRMAVIAGSRFHAMHSVPSSGTRPPYDWWEIPTQGYKGAHYATFPDALCDRPILSMVPERVCTECGLPSTRTKGDPENWTACGHDAYRRGVVLDPFGGSGTVAAVAQKHGRNSISIDIDERNAHLARERVGMFLTIEGAT